MIKAKSVLARWYAPPLISAGCLRKKHDSPKMETMLSKGNGLSKRYWLLYGCCICDRTDKDAGYCMSCLTTTWSTGRTMTWPILLIFRKILGFVFLLLCSLDCLRGPRYHASRATDDTLDPHLTPPTVQASKRLGRSIFARLASNIPLPQDSTSSMLRKLAGWIAVFVDEG